MNFSGFVAIITAPANTAPAKTTQNFSVESCSVCDYFSIRTRYPIEIKIMPIESYD